jgi:4-hydroxy-2-oxoheptanedioate aldolase
MKPNALKALFKRGEPAYGLNLMFPSVQMIEIIGKLGFDWVFIDLEHGAITIESLDGMIAAADAAGITAIVRPASNDPVLIGQVLDRGAHGIQVPHVETAGDAQRVVSAAKYAPQGERGLAGGTRASGYGVGFRPKEFIEGCNRETLVCVQLEHRNAVANLPEILMVEGVDVFFVGPVDLSLSYGHPGDFDAPEVRQAIEYCFKTIRAAGKTSGGSGNPATLRRFREAGVQYLYTHLQTLLIEGRDKFRATIEGAVAR